MSKLTFPILLALAALSNSASAADLRVLFLGDNGHHKPRERFVQIQPVLKARGIQVDYTDDLRDVNLKNLRGYAALLLFANIDRIEPEPEKALLEYVNAGGGFVPVHCATYCFRNSDDVVALMGGQFKSHGTGVFRTEIAQPDHPVMKGFGGFESWDETYVHHLHNEKNRTVLAYRVDGDHREPWTWVRTHGKGRVFYTAWGHDHRTWGNAGFQNLLERGIRWSAGKDLKNVPSYLIDQPFPIPKMTELPTDVKPFEYVDVGKKIPNYTPGEKWGTQGEILSKMQKPLPAEESLKHMVTPQGFHVKLFAAEPDIGGKPLCMAWDERGRLWIAETFDYPNELQPPGQGRDRIRILEDTDGDWRADKFTVFVDKLSIPTSITFSRGGVIVQDSTKTWFFKDTDGDDVADERRLLFDGWNQGDTHGGVSNFQYGLDNWIWAMQGYNNSRPRGDGETHQSFRQGFFRFRPDGSDLEFVRSTNNNTWGLGISEEGLIFGSTANRHPSVFMPIPNRYYESVRGWAPSLTLSSIADTHLFQPITKNIRQVDHHGGYTAAAGHALYTARKYPREYWNRTAFVNGPTGHLVGTFVLKREGTGYRSTSPFNLLASNDEWTAPIMSEVGPDGNVWVIDWYNYIVQHNPTPQGFKTGKGNAYISDLRDKKHGRIYRVVYGEQEEKPFTLADASPEQLVAALKHPTMLWRKHAQRLLVERGKTDVVPRLMDLVKDQSVDAIGLNVGAIHALWTLHGLGQLDGTHQEINQLAFAALKHPSAGVRLNALRVLPANRTAAFAIFESKTLGDPDAQVRLAAAIAISDQQPNERGAGYLLYLSVKDSSAISDEGMQHAVTAAAARQPSFLIAACRSEKPYERFLNVVRIVAEHQARSGQENSVRRVMRELVVADEQVVDAMLAGFASGWPTDKQITIEEKAEKELREWAAKLPARQRGDIVKLAGHWGWKSFRDLAKEVSRSLLAAVDDESLAAPKRIQAAREVVAFLSADDDVIDEVLERITPQTETALAVGLVQSLGGSRAEGAGEVIVQKLPSLTPRVRSEAIKVLLARPASTESLLDAMDKGAVLLSELSLEQKETLSAHPNNDIRKRSRELLSRGGALPSPDRQKVLAELMPLTEQKGDATAGMAVFKKQCGKCHVHSGEGTRIGPDLTGMAAHPKAELLTHIIDPNRDVEGNFRVYKLMTNEGLVHTGLLASESKTAVELFDVEGKKQVVLREDIARLIASRKSLMPEGFEKQVKPTDIINLLEFLTQRGQFLPLDLRKVATIASDRGMFFSKDADVERLIFSDWKPKTFKKVPFHLTDPQDGKTPNVIFLHGPIGAVSKLMPKSVSVPYHGPARALHLLSGISGWGFPYARQETVSMIVRLHYADGKREDHELKNGVHFADYIRRVDVKQSEFAFALRGQQIRYLAVYPKRADSLERIEFVKGPDNTAPVVMAVTVESPTSGGHGEE